MNDEKQMFETVQKCLEAERRQSRTLLVVVVSALGLVIAALIVIGVIFISSLSKQNARLLTITIDGDRLPSTVFDAPPCPPSMPLDAPQQPSKAVVAVVTEEEEEAPASPPPDAIVNLAMPDAPASPVRIPAYTEEKMQLITERGVLIPWLVLIPE